jgi:succinate dehydrogenase/fumarate reductase cytochrome b subunit
MPEATARKIHRTVGVYLVGFLILQLTTGLFISLGTLMDTPRETFWFAAMAWIHHEGNPVGSVYRILLGALGVAQGLGGVVIYLLMRRRLAKP